MDPAYDAVAAAARAVGLRAERVKDVKGDYRIAEKILAMIRRARLIVADLTDERPNVYFEEKLGYARGLGKTIVTVLRSGTTPHFDVYDCTYLEVLRLQARSTPRLGRAPQIRAPEDTRVTRK